MPSQKITQIWSSPARGRKQCRSCSIYVATRAHVCRCGFVFSKSKNPKANHKNRILDEVPIRVLTNPPPGVKPKLEEKEQLHRRRIHPKQAFWAGLDNEETLACDTRPILFAPAGPCPVSLMGPGLRDVQTWMDDLAALHPGLRLAPECFLAWLASFYPRDTARFMVAAKHVRGHAEPIHSKL